MNGRYRPPIYLLLASLVVYAILFALGERGLERLWVDRAIVAEISLSAAFAVYAMGTSTPKWTIRGLGIFGFMLAIVIYHIAIQFAEWRAVRLALPFYVVNIWRSILLVSGALMLYGFAVWARSSPIGQPPGGTTRDDIT